MKSEEKSKSTHSMSIAEKQFTPLPNEAEPQQARHVARQAGMKALSEIKRTKKPK